jgi:hypothetical protein
MDSGEIKSNKPYNIKNVKLVEVESPDNITETAIQVDIIRNVETQTPASFPPNTIFVTEAEYESKNFDQEPEGLTKYVEKINVKFDLNEAADNDFDDSDITSIKLEPDFFEFVYYSYIDPNSTTP